MAVCLVVQLLQIVSCVGVSLSSEMTFDPDICDCGSL